MRSEADPESLALARDACLLHIGPPKTGTTTVQGAFHLARDQLAGYGVLYAGKGRQTARAALAVTGLRQIFGMWRPKEGDWTELVEEVAAAADQRVVVSSELFADAADDVARRVVTDLGGSRVHVVVTLRPLRRILVSQWQQYVQNGFRMPYARWLDGVFNKPPKKAPTPTFWRRHRHDELVARWADAVGAENLTVVVADDSEPTSLVRAFESLLQLPAGVLVPEREVANRSLTLGEAEMLRLLNVQFKLRDLPPALYSRFLRHGAVKGMKTGHQPLPSEPRIVTPQWALDRAVEIDAAAAANLAASGVRIVGDISLLGAAPTEGRGARPDTDQPAMLSAEAAAQAVMGAIDASGATDPLRRIDSKSLVREVARRGRRRVRRTLRRR